MIGLLDGVDPTDWLPPVITAVGAVVLALVMHRLRRENSEQHAEGRAKLDRIAGTLEVVHGDVVATRGEVAGLGERVAVVEHQVDELKEAPNGR